MNIEIKMSKTDSGAQSLNLGYSQVTLILDGKEHFLSNSPESDGYFQKYTADCTDSMILISESGTNNNSKMKRVDSYQSLTYFLLFPSGRLEQVMGGTQVAVDGKVAFTGKITYSYNKK